MLENEFCPYLVTRKNRYFLTGNYSFLAIEIISELDANFKDIFFNFYYFSSRLDIFIKKYFCIKKFIIARILLLTKG